MISNYWTRFLQNRELRHRRPWATNGQPEVKCSFCWTVSATCLRLENSCFDVWWLAVTDAMVSKRVKEKKLTSVPLAVRDSRTSASASVGNWSARHWQLTIFCSTSSNNCLVFKITRMIITSWIFSFSCFSATVELTNGTLAGIRGCYTSFSQGLCSNSTACNQSISGLPAGVQVKRCIAECCPGGNCNLIPMFPVIPSPSVTAMVSTSSDTTSQPTETTAAVPKGPTAAGDMIKAPFYFGTFLLIIAHIMN